MSLRSPLFSCLPDETARVARAAFPRGNPYLRMYDMLGPLFASPAFADLYPGEGQPAIDPAVLALVTIFQFVEGLPDRQAADAVRGRIDWKYALCLPLEDESFDASVLSEFRARLIAGGAERRLFETLLERLKEEELVKPRGRQRTDSTHVLAAIQMLSRLECMGEMLRHALDTLARVAPDWLRQWVPAAWFDHYGQRFQDYRLPKGKAARTALAEQIGADGRQLLAAIFDPDAPAYLREVPAVQTLWRCWLQQFHAGNPIRWREATDLPPAPLLLITPYDPEARYSRKRAREWVGYKIHLTETCDEGGPNSITDVATTPAPVPDNTVTGAVQSRLAARGLAPREHLVDAGYVSAAHLVGSRTTHDCDLVGPTGPERSWQARADAGFATTDFAFGLPACRACAVRTQCVASGRERVLRIRRREEYAALQAARQRQVTPAFRAQYAARAGIEGTISQGVHRCDLRRARYIGLAKTELEHLLIGAALNFQRVATWFAGTSRARTRRSAFAALAGAEL